MYPKIVNWFLQLFIKSLVKLLPDRMKRLLVVVSLYNHLLEKGNLSDSERQVRLSELNDALKLATTSSRSLALGLLFSRPLWEGSGTNDLHELGRKRVGQYVPSWLRYGRDVDIEADLRNLDKFIMDSRHA